jgi:hypothetical protein
MHRMQRPTLIQSHFLKYIDLLSLVLSIQPLFALWLIYLQVKMKNFTMVIKPIIEKTALN